jgi:hypothetical protein
MLSKTGSGTPYVPSDEQLCNQDYVHDCERARCEPLWDHEVFVSSFAHEERYYHDDGTHSYHYDCFEKED